MGGGRGGGGGIGGREISCGVFWLALLYVLKMKECLLVGWLFDVPATC